MTKIKTIYNYSFLKFVFLLFSFASSDLSFAVISNETKCIEAGGTIYRKVCRCPDSVYEEEKNTSPRSNVPIASKPINKMTIINPSNDEKCNLDKIVKDYINRSPVSIFPIKVDSKYFLLNKKFLKTFVQNLIPKNFNAIKLSSEQIKKISESIKSSNSDENRNNPSNLNNDDLNKILKYIDYRNDVPEKNKIKQDKQKNEMAALAVLKETIENLQPILPKSISTNSTCNASLEEKSRIDSFINFIKRIWQ